MGHPHCHDDLSTVGPFPPGRNFSSYGGRGLQVVMLSVLVVRHSKYFRKFSCIIQTVSGSIALRFFVSDLGAYQVLPGLIIILYFTCLWAVRDLNLTLSHKGMFLFSSRSILLPFIFSVIPDHLIFMVSHKACLSSCIFQA